MSVLAWFYPMGECGRYSDYPLNSYNSIYCGGLYAEHNLFYTVVNLDFAQPVLAGYIWTPDNYDVYDASACGDVYGVCCYTHIRHMDYTRLGEYLTGAEDLYRGRLTLFENRQTYSMCNVVPMTRRLYDKQRQLSKRLYREAIEEAHIYSGTFGEYKETLMSRFTDKAIYMPAGVWHIVYDPYRNQTRIWAFYQREVADGQTVDAGELERLANMRIPGLYRDTAII